MANEEVASDATFRLGVSCDPGIWQRGLPATRNSPGYCARDRARFGQESELRRVQMESLLWLVELAHARAFSESLSTAVSSPTSWNLMT